MINTHRKELSSTPNLEILIPAVISTKHHYECGFSFNFLLIMSLDCHHVIKIKCRYSFQLKVFGKTLKTH